MANEIEVRLVLDDGSYQKGIIKIEKDAKESGKKIGGALEGSIGSGLLKSLTPMRGLILGIGSALVTAFAGKQFINAAIESENAVSGLNQALRSAGTFSKEASESIQAFATQMQSSSLMSDEAVLDLYSYARALTKTNEEAQKMTQAAIELSAATGISADTAVTQLSKSLSGMGGRLAEVLPAIRGMTAEQLKSGAAMDYVLERFGGSAQAQVKTFGGAVHQLKNAFSDLVENIGGIVTNSTGLRAAIGFISESVFKLVSRIADFGKSGSFVDQLVIALLNVAKVITQFVLPPIEMMVDTFQAAIRVIDTGFRALFAGVAKTISAASNLFSPTSQFAKDAKQFSDYISQGFIDSANATSQSIAEIGTDFAMTNEIDEFITAMQTRVETAVYSSEQLKEGVGSNVTQLAETVKEKSDEINKAMRATLAGGISRGIQSITTALIKGGNVFEAFAGGVLNTFGDLAIQLGEFYIAQGIANLALKTVDPTATIAAGAGLIALGTILKSFFGGQGGTQPASTASGGPVGGGGLSDPASDVFASPEELEERGPAVTVNISGNVLDRRETGLEIVNIINEAFEQQGAVVRTV